MVESFGSSFIECFIIISAWDTPKGKKDEIIHQVYNGDNPVVFAEEDLAGMVGGIVVVQPL